MKFKLIETPEEYDKAIEFLEELGDREDFQDNEELINDFELLSKLIDIYDSENYPIKAGNPIEIIKLKMDYMGLKRKDLFHIASSGVLSDVFNNKRGLSKTMIREFAKLLKIDQSLLNQAEPFDAVTITDQVPIVLESPFGFIKKTTTNLREFKRRTRQNHMLFNINTLIPA